MRHFTSILLTALIPLTITGCASATPSGETPGGSTSESPAVTEPTEWTVELLEGFPDDVVPLFEADLIDTVYYSVRNDPQWAAVEGGLRNIHHVVYQTSKTQAEVLDFYLDLMDSTTDADTGDGYIEGTIDVYDIDLNTTVESSYTAVYLTVDLPRDELTEVNPFYADYPTELVETPAEFVFFEQKYYAYLYRSTDMAYWQQFDIADWNDDGRPDFTLDELYAWYTERYGEKTDFTVDRDGRQITWTDGTYSVTLAFYESGGRGVLQLGWDWEG